MRQTPTTLAGLLLALILLSCSAALAAGAAPGAPQTVAVSDVAGDTGTALRLTFARSADDGAGENDVASYKVFRRVAGGAPTYLTPITATGAATYALNITGLTAGTKYGIGVSAYDGSLESTVVVVWATAVNNTAPPAGPGAVKVTDVAGDAGTALRLAFSRSADDGAGGNDVVSYKIFRRVSGGAATYLSPVTATGAATYARVITGLTAGQSYGIGVAAFDGTLTSAATVVWATPVDNVTPPPPATNVAVADVPNDLGTALRLTFSRSADDRTGGDVTGYRVFKRLPGGKATYLPLIAATHATTYALTITDLTPGQQYGIGVRAFDGNLLSDPAVAWGTPVDNLTPDPPAGLTLSDPPGDNGTTLAITFSRSPDDVSGGSVTAYQIVKRTRDTAFSLVKTVTATQAASYSHVLTGLTRGTRYGLGVRATDGTHHSAYVTRWAAPQDTLAPGPPSNLLLVNPPTDNGTTMQLTFSPSADDVSGGDVVAYRFFKRTTTGALAPAGSLRATRASLYAYVFKNLTVGVRYGFAVCAFDGVNESTKVIVWGDSAPPGAPQNVQLVDYPADDGDALKLTFNRSADDGAGANDVAVYRIFRRTADTSLTLLTSLTATGAASYAYDLTGLTKGTNYGVAVCAYDGFQESARVIRWLVPVDNTPPAAAGAPTVSDWPSDDGSALAVDFAASADDTVSDGEVARYFVYRDTTATGAGTKVGEVTATGAASYQFKSTGLTAGTTYWYWVVAVGPAGTSAATTRASGVPVDQRPVAAPSGLAGEDHPYDAGGVIDLTWTASGDDGAGTKRVTRYVIYRRMANVQTDPVQIGTLSATGAATYAWSDSAVPLDLILYEYTVRATTATGALSAAAGPLRLNSEDNNVLTFEAPTNLTATSGGSGKIVLSWYRSSSEDDIGGPPPPPITSTKGGYGGTYEFYRRTATGSYTVEPTFTVSADGTNDPMSYTDSGLTNGVTYYYKVRYRRYNMISAFTAEASAKPSATSTQSVSDGTAGEATSGTATKDADATDLSAVLVDAPGQVALGRDLALQVAVSAPARSSVCLQYTVGEAAARTAAVSGTGRYQAELRLRTSTLAAGTVVRVRAVVTAADGRTAASTAATITVGQ